MALNKYKLGELIELQDARNEDLKYGIEDVKGISIQKVFIETKADMQGVSLRPYYLVKPDSFAYVTVTSRNSEKITIAHNTTNETYIVSSSYVVFKVKRDDLLLSDYLFMYFNRPEFDRYARFNSWGSARETFSWDEMCDIDIQLPPLAIQRKYVDVYNAMLKNQMSYERGLEDLRISCIASIEQLKKKYQSVVYKRRLAISASEIYYCFKNKLDINDNSQIAKEINYYRKFYADLRPAMFISYQREAYCQKNDDMRITFDCDIKYRNNSFSLNNTNGINILDNNQFLMEIKTSKSIPLHLARIFSQLNINKTSFSKYGSAYYQMINQKEVNKC